MRQCIRCGSQMEEGYDLKIQGQGYGLTLTDSEKVFAHRLGKPKAAFCPSCGEISLYMEIDDTGKKEEYTL